MPPAWPVLDHVALLLEAHPDGRKLEHRLGDVIRCAEIAARRGVGFDAEAWTCCALGHARVKELRGANPVAALWWALTRAAGLADLEADVSPHLEEHLENARRRVTTEAPRRRAQPFDGDPASVPPPVPHISDPSPGETRPETWLERLRRLEGGKP